MPALALAVQTSTESHSAVLRTAQSRHSYYWQTSSSNEAFRNLAWLTAFCGCFLIIGIAGVIRHDFGISMILLSSAAAPAGIENPGEMTTMADLLASSEAEQASADSVPDETILDIPFTQEEPLEFQDLPELIPALLTEDLFTIPAAPKIETALTPIEPEKPRAESARRPSTSPATSTTNPTRTRPSRTTTGSGSGGGGGTGGTGISGTGGGGRFPTPPYPSFARSRGIQGTVTLTIVVNDAGLVEKTLVLTSTGFSELDSYAASWVRRNWRFPVGNARTVRLPIAFKLR